MGPRKAVGRPTMDKSRRTTRRSGVERDVKLNPFLEDFLSKVRNRGTHFKNLLNCYSKSLVTNCDIILAKIPKCRADVPVEEYFGAKNVRQKIVKNVQMPTAEIKRMVDVIVTPYPTANVQQPVSSRVLRSAKRSSQSSNSFSSGSVTNSKSKRQTRTQKKSKAAKKTSRKPLSQLVGNENVILDGMAGSMDYVAHNLENFRNMQTPIVNMVDVLPNCNLGISTKSGPLIYMNECKPALILPNGGASMIVITPETSVEKMRLDELTKLNLKILHDKLGSVLQLCKT